MPEQLAVPVGDLGAGAPVQQPAAEAGLRRRHLADVRAHRGLEGDARPGAARRRRPRRPAWPARIVTPGGGSAGSGSGGRSAYCPAGSSPAAAHQPGALPVRGRPQHRVRLGARTARPAQRLGQRLHRRRPVGGGVGPGHRAVGGVHPALVVGGELLRHAAARARGRRRPRPPRPARRRPAAAAGPAGPAGRAPPPGRRWRRAAPPTAGSSAAVRGRTLIICTPPPGRVRIGPPPPAILAGAGCRARAPVAGPPAP